MRKVVASMFLSLDGVMEDPGGAEKSPYGGWTVPYWDDEIGKFKFEELFASDALLLGRVTYEGFAAVWPSQQDQAGFADRMNSMPKYVVSTTLRNPEWNNSTVIKGNVVEEIARLREQPGQDILIAGSAQLVNTLVQHDLVDEYRLLVYPVVLGGGKHLFQEGSNTNLQLVESQALPSGVVLLTYRRDRGEADNQATS